MKRNKYFYSIVSMLLFLLLLTACTNDSNDESAEETPDNDAALETENPDAADGEDIESDDAENKESDNEGDNTSENTEQDVSDSKESDILENYFAEEIEYARVWLQLGENPEIDRLNARHVPAGDPINSLDEESAEYPEDVIELRGGPDDGAVTYSSNEDGTINVYDVSRQLEKNDNKEALQNEYEAILEEQEIVEIDTGNPEDIKELIDEALTIQYEDTFEEKVEDASENEEANTSNNTEENASETEEDSILDDYSAEEIEYARIWLQLSELEEPSNENLYVRHISAGEPLNEVDEESAAYPEDVTVLDGGRQPGVITYSSNEDGTINVYNIPPRWGNNAGEEALQNTYNKILEEVELVEVDTGNPEDVKKVIDAYLIME